MGTFRAPSGTEEGAISLNKYLELYKFSDQTIDSFYVDSDNTLHLFDIFDNYLNDYEDKNMIKVQLTEEELEDFKYSPKALAYKLYGTPDYWTILLRISNVNHPGEFIPTKIMSIPSPDSLLTFFNKMKSIKERIGEWVDFKDTEDIFR